MAARLHDDITDERVDPSGAAWADHAARYRYVASQLGLAPTVLDVGTGTGHGQTVMPGFVVGVDMSLTALTAARDRSDCPQAAADALALPFRDARFTAVTCFEVIEHVPDPDVLVAELARVTDADGRVFVSTPHARMEDLFARACGRERWEYHINPLTPWQLYRTLRRHFGHVVVMGQSKKIGAAKLLIKSLDVAGLRFRVRRNGAPLSESVTREVDVEAGHNGFVFSRGAALGADQLFAVASRPKR